MPDIAGYPLGIVVVVFCLAGLLVLLCGVRLTSVADRFADVSGIGEAVTGAVLLGALTSLSGSIASLTAAAKGHPELALSNAVGGIAAQTAFLVVADVAYRRANLEHAAASVPNMMLGTMLIVLLGVALLATTLPPMSIGGVHPATPLLFLLYAGGVRLASRANAAPMWTPDRTVETREDVPAEPRGGRRSVGGLLVVLLLLGACVGGAGWVIAEAGLAIAAKTGLREGLVGALLTSVVTSTPELVTTVVAVRRGALTLAVSGIVGGNTFDVLFIAISDLAYPAGSIYHAIDADQVFLILLTIVMTATLLLGLLRRERHGPGNIGFESVALLLLYGGGLAALILVF